MKSIRKVQWLAPVMVVTVFMVLLSIHSRSVAQADSLAFSGTVTTPTGGVYSDGGNVNLYGQSSGGYSGINDSGKFEITGVQPGTYTLDIGVPMSSSFANPAQQQITLTASITNFQVKVATPILKGVLAKPDGTPTNGCVNVRNSTWTVNRGSCPGDDGKFKIGALETGTYLLETNPPDNAPYVGTDQSVTITDPATTQDLGTIKFDNPFIVGKVALPNGTLVPWSNDWDKRVQLSVDLWNSDNTVNKHSNYDQDSKFKFGKVPAGSYTLHVNVWDTELYTGSENVALTVPSGGLDLTANPVKLTTPQLAGVVYRPDGTTPIHNAWVNLHNDDWSQNQGSNTDENGKYRIGGLPAGTYKLEVNPPQDMTDVVRPDPVDVVITTSVTTKNITLSAAKKYVNGTVKRKDGSAVTCAQVNANKRGGNGWANTRTKSDGSYTLTLAPGSWNIRVEPDRGFDCPSPDWIFIDPEGIVEFSTDNTTQVETLNFTVQKATAIITGRVTKKDGTAVSNGNVNANSQTQDGRNRWSNAQIRADGSYTIYLVAGIYDVNVWTPDNRLYAKNQKVSVSDNQTVTVNFIMGEKLAHITGRVTNKSGAGLANIQINGNLDCGPEGCSAWSNTKTDANGNYDLAATKGRWFINFDGGQNSTYVYDGPQNDIYVESETATVSGVNFALTYADVTVKGKIVDENGKPFADFPGWAFVRPTTVSAETGVREYGGPVNQGAFNFRVPSSLFRQAELGVHTSQNSQYSPVTGQTVTLVADATIEKDIMVKKNDAAIIGRVVTNSGMPLDSCNFRGEVYANSPNYQWFGTQINPDCTFQISLLAGTYQIGYNFDPSAGFLNRPPSNAQVTVASGTSVKYDIKVLAGDSRVSVLVLNPDGTPARHVWVWADNHEEIDQMRRAAEQSTRDENFRGPGGTSSPEEVLKYCSKSENEKECRDFKLPPGSQGPGGCKDALACTQYCQKHKKECEREFKGEGPQHGDVGIQSVTVLQRKSRVAGLKVVKALAETTDHNDEFDNMLNSGSETNDVGVATLSLLSNHEYTVNAGLPPGSEYMPPRMAQVSLVATKSASVTLQLRQADGKMSGFVTWNKVAVGNGWIGCWSEDGNSAGSPIIGGTYSMNYTFNSLYHCNANSQSGTSFLNSKDIIVIIGTEKKKTQNFTLDEANFQIPPPVSESFDATQPHVLTLADGTAINIPANALGSSGTVTVNANPTINIQSQKTAQPIGYGYSLEAIDSNGTPITKFNSNVTVTFTYTDEQLAEAGIEEGSLVPSYWDSSSGAWKQPPNVTHDQANNTITVTSDHFSSYAIVSSSGKSRGRTMTQVKVTKQRGITQITVGIGAKRVKFKPFSGFKGKVSVGTLVTKQSGQVIVAGQNGSSTDTTVVKVFDIKGKPKQTIKPWGNGYRNGLRLSTNDLTKDTYDDVILTPISERTVVVFDPSNKKSHSVDAGAKTGVLAQALDLGTGSKQLVTKAGSQLSTWKFGKKGFSKSSYDLRKLSVRGDTIERVILQPTISSVSPTTITLGKGSVTIRIRGQNLGLGSKVLLNQSIPAKKIVARGETELVVTFNASFLGKKKKYDLTVINGDGGQVMYRSIKTK